jgi:hypothetical protein
MLLILMLAFFSHKLSPTESRYSTFNRELLAAFQAVKHFGFFLEGCPFTLFTDHKTLVACHFEKQNPFLLSPTETFIFLI